jgi:hypothetical protein
LDVLPPELRQAIIRHMAAIRAAAESLRRVPV